MAGDVELNNLEGLYPGSLETIDNLERRVVPNYLTLKFSDGSDDDDSWDREVKYEQMTVDVLLISSTQFTTSS